MTTQLISTLCAAFAILLSPTAFAQDTDGDGLDDAAEMLAGSDPANVDTDADGLGDGVEVLVWGSDPLLRDSDGGGEMDLAEIFMQGTNPADPADDVGGVDGNGAFHYWINVASQIRNYNIAEAALASLTYVQIRSFTWPFLTDFRRSENGDFDVNHSFNGIWGGNRDDYAGAIHGWLYIEPTAAASNEWSIAVGAAEGWNFRVWDGSQIDSFNNNTQGFRAKREVFGFPPTGGMFPFDLVTWEQHDEEALELSWAQGDVNWANGAGFSLIPSAYILASHLHAEQTLVDLNGGTLQVGDTVRATVTLTNTGKAAAYNILHVPTLSADLTFGAYAPVPAAWNEAGANLTIPILDAGEFVEFQFTVTVQAGGPYSMQGQLFADPFPAVFGIGARHIRVHTDDPLFIGATDTANAPIGLIPTGLDDDDPNEFDIGGTLDIDECLAGTHDCDVNAFCTDVPGSWNCTCNVGWTGTGQTCTDIDECASGANGCDVNPNAICANVPGSFTCVCDVGYTGDGITCVDVDECADGSANCDPNASCTNSIGGFACACDSGWNGDGFVCADVDECADGSAGCSADAACNNLPGSFDCACLPGFVGDGLVCTDVDECLATPCDTNATCVNSPGMFSCTCDSGFVGDGLTCVDDDECATGTAGCDANAVCTNSVGGFDCDCSAGFNGDGLLCSDIDECADGTDSCAPNATCTNTAGAFLCECNPGYEGDGLSCDDIDECAGSHDCDTNAICTNTDGAFDCACAAGFDGDGRVCTAADCPCTMEQVCVGGECFDSCSEDDDCAEPGDRCYDERCAADPCERIECPAGEACVGGGCFSTCDSDVDCEDPSDFCFASRCASEPCQDIICAASQVCYGGGCFETCEGDVDCSNPNHQCYENRCAENPCDDVACGEGRACYGGACFDICGADVDCSNPDDRCYDGRCTDDPCRDVQCASSQTCWGGGCFDACGADVDCEETSEACYASRCATDICERVQCPSAEACDPADGLCGSANVPQDTCGCASMSDGASEAWLAVLVIGGLRARRRRRA